ncbi:MAG: aminopeptidase P family protein [Chloroflexi bacterium]|nr:MAG: aminopeptidase P family protein [Chloroflexota bacterium]TMF73089.1 MAG: aminopeptidase P family protein [Chloroflexota bacterium]TMF79062.1 MAG: aminopeptidase P family protein [Chloroflexota bacterium]TMG43347.1 MAG: aminopeptidase P family protein [Chloroflexota bacterium]
MPGRSSSCRARKRLRRPCGSLPRTRKPSPATKPVPSPLPGRPAAGPPHMVGRRHIPTISMEEYAFRRECVSAGMQASGLDAMCVFYPARVAYLTGFHHVPTERPIALIIGSSGQSSLVVPAVEKEHAESATSVDQVRIYFEYPGAEHPMESVVEVLTEMNARPHRTGADHDGYIPYWGYRGPRLSDLTGVEPFDSELIIESLRRVKSTAELECIQLSCDWAVRAHRRMQAAITTGKTEMECYTPAAEETLFEMVHEMPGWRPRGADDSGIIAMFVAGRSTAMPHGFVKGHGIQPGDVLVSGAGANIDGYRSELERTMIVGEPTPEQVRAFEAMLALQTRAIEVMAPGVPAGEVELATVRLAQELGVEANLRHHAGHSIGLEGHEAPFLDRGDEAVLEPGMVFTVEPGVYLQELGGFRHSDTVVITEDGRRVMTDYPRELKDLIVSR